MPRSITEDDADILASWKAEARQINTTEELAVFINRLISDYSHDYGTIIHAMFAAMQAAMRVIDRGPQGGITGFQAGCLGWMFVHEYLSHGQDGPIRLQIFDDMLYPQNSDRFKDIMSEETWKWLQEKAASNLTIHRSAHPDVIKHWENIVAGGVPFGWRLEK